MAHHQRRVLLRLAPYGAGTALAGCDGNTGREPERAAANQYPGHPDDGRTVAPGPEHVRHAQEESAVDLRARYGLPAFLDRRSGGRTAAAPGMAQAREPRQPRSRSDRCEKG